MSYHLILPNVELMYDCKLELLNPNIKAHALSMEP